MSEQVPNININIHIAARLRLTAAIDQLDAIRAAILIEVKRLDELLDGRSKCTFCGEPHYAPTMLSAFVSSNGVSICNVCVAKAVEMEADVD